MKSTSGKFELETPRDRAGTFEPQLVKKHQRTVSDEIESKILSMYGLGMSYADIAGHVEEMYGIGVSPATISTITDKLIDEYCGGMQDGHSFKAYLPGGASGGILPASMGDLPLEFGSLEQYGCFVGSHAVIILSDQDNTRDAALNLMRFFEDESCGQCTPCRVGTEKAVKLMQQRGWDEPLLQELSQTISDASICGLGQAASNPLRCVLEHFREDWS